VKQSKYEIKLDRLIKGESTTSITVNTLGSKSTITLERNAVTSGAPLEGNFKVRCRGNYGLDAQGNEKFWDTLGMNWDKWTTNIGRVIEE